MLSPLSVVKREYLMFPHVTGRQALQFILHNVFTENKLEHSIEESEQALKFQKSEH